MEKEPKKIGTIIISEIIGDRPKKPASYNLRKLRKTKDDLIFCHEFEQKLIEWDNKAKKIRKGDPATRKEVADFVVKEKPKMVFTNKILHDDFIQAYKILKSTKHNVVEFNPRNPYSNTDEPNQLLFTMIYYFMRDERFFKSPLLRSDLSKPSFDKGTLTIGGFGCGKSSLLFTFDFIFRKYYEVIKKEMPSNQDELIELFRMKSCISTDIANKYNVALSKVDAGDLIAPLMSSVPLYVDDLTREKDVHNFHKRNIFLDVLTHRADRSYKTHLSMNYTEKIVGNEKIQNNTEESLYILKNRYDGRIHDRAFEMYNIIELKGKSFRR